MPPIKNGTALGALPLHECVFLGHSPQRFKMNLSKRSIFLTGTQIHFKQGTDNAQKDHLLFCVWDTPPGLN